MDTLVIRPHRRGDRVAIEALVSAAGLPVPRPDEHPVEFLVAVAGGELVGCCGWEIHGDHALLRSVVVGPTSRSQGIGQRLVGEAVAALGERALATVTLVTLDADGFFAGLGFSAIDRGEVSAAVRSSPEFSAHACLGGHWMRREL